MKKQISILSVLLLLTLTAFNQGSMRIAINEGWSFHKGDTVDGKDWVAIQLPHTWNIQDVMDEEPGYYRGNSWYKKNLNIPIAWKGKDIYLYFEGANQVADIFFNGQKAGSHAGGYTGFSIPVTRFVKAGTANEVLIRVNNGFNENIPPLSADFTFYGGVYRDVFLEVKGNIHFDNADHGSGGIYITTPHVSAKSADVSITSLIAGSVSNQNLYLLQQIIDPNGKEVGHAQTLIRKGLTGQIRQNITGINQPKLWSPENPERYLLVSTIKDQQGKILDQQKNYFGFRWFHFDPEKGFILNGRPYKLMGASRHQDYKGMGNAVSDSLAVQDVVFLKNMGANFLRVAHYPQDPAVMNACDSLGLLTSVEIPIVNEITETDSFVYTSENMLEEMIKQNFNHPSVILWCYMNEVLLKPHFPGDKPRQEKYFAAVHALAQRLETKARALDPGRYTFMANHGNLAQYEHAQLINVPHIVGWNLYSGWYGGSLKEFPNFLDSFHKRYPSIPVLVTEFGADADPRIRSNQPVRFDKSVEYTTYFHQFYFREIMKRSYVSGAVVWNLADFNSETRTETMPHINNKGLMEWDRTPKDPYFFYQAVLTHKPMVKILGVSRQIAGLRDSAAKSVFPLQVATTADSVLVGINNETPKWFYTVQGIAKGDVLLSRGPNKIIAACQNSTVSITDSASTFVYYSSDLLRNENNTFTSLNILMGCTRYYTGNDGTWWQPDHPYRKGGWGSVGGTYFKLKNNSRLPYGTDKDILETEDDPIYQTQLVGIKEYHADVPPGIYELNFHFAELLGGKVSVPPYNLTTAGRTEDTPRRIFNVSVNGRPFLDHFDITSVKGAGAAVQKKYRLTVAGDEGIVISFIAQEDEPVLNALQIKKINDTIGK